MVRRRGFGCWVRDGNYILRFCGVMCHVLGLQPALNHKFHLVATFMWDLIASTILVYCFS